MRLVLLAGPPRAALVGSSAEELGRRREELQRVLSGELSGAPGVCFARRPLGGRLAVMFPGDGSYYSGMIRSFAERFGEVRRWLELADRMTAREGREPVGRLMVSGAELREVEDSAPAVLAVNQALFSLLQGCGVRPGALLGHSLGDWSAHLAGGVLDFERFLAEFGRLFSLTDQVVDREGRMAVVSAARERVEGVLEGEVYLAMHNAPDQVVIAGLREDVARALARLRRQGIRTYLLPMRRAVHTPLVAPLRRPVREAAERWIGAPPRVEIWSCASGRPYPRDLAGFRDLAAETLVRPVEFVRAVEGAYRSGVRLFLECGAGGHLAECVGRILAGRPHRALAVDRPGKGVAAFLEALGWLWAEGVEVDPTPLEDSEPPGLLRSLEETTRALEGHTRAVGDLLARSEAIAVRWLQAQGEMAAVVGRRASGRREGSTAAAWREISPGGFGGKVVEWVAGRRVVVHLRLEPRLPFLRDHCIAGFVPRAEHTMGPLPVLPLAGSLEIMAGAAALLFPGQVVVEGRELVVSRQVDLEEAAVLEVTAELTGPEEARVQLFHRGIPSAAVRLRFAAGYPEAPPPELPDLASPRAPEIADERLYTEGYLFHGPRWRAVRSMGPLGEEGIDAVLEALPREDLVEGPDRFATPLILLDAMSHPFAYWSLERFAGGRSVVFPTHVAHLELFAPPPPPGRRVACRVRVVEVGAKSLTGVIELVTAGRLILRAAGYRFWRFNWPPGFVRFLRQPQRRFGSDPFPVRAEGVATARVEQHQPLELLDFLVRAVFSRRDGEHYRRLPERGRERERFYLKRLVAKDAVRRRVLDREGVWVAAHDVEILRDRSYLAGRGEGPFVAVACRGPVVAAVAADRPVGLRLGEGGAEVVEGPGSPG